MIFKKTITKIKANLSILKDYRKRKQIEKQFPINFKRPFVKISPDLKTIEEDLKRNGIVKFPTLFTDIANYIENEYFEKIENNLPVIPWSKDMFNERTLKTGRPISQQISFNDRNLEDIFFNPDILGLVYNYFKCQPYYRNLPALAKHEFKDNHVVDIQGKFHLDGGLNQVSFMLFINDIGLEDTHMQYAIGSNNKKVPINIDRFSWDDDTIIKENKIYDVIGPKGTLFIFDAGSGYHRAVYKKGIRKILHLNLTRGHTLQGQKEYDTSSFGFLANKPDFVQKSLDKLI